MKTREYSFEEKLAITDFLLDVVWLGASYYRLVGPSVIIGVVSLLLSALLFLRALFKSEVPWRKRFLMALRCALGRSKMDQ
jgi:hypothetical protein